MSTGIQWTDETWNPIRGCSRVSEGCRHCYAEVVAARFSGPGQAYEGLARRTANGGARWTGKIMFVEKHLEDPLRWKEPRRIFVNSMSDLFHENVTDQQLDRIFDVMAKAQRHTFQVLTKRPERMLEYSMARLAGLPLPNVWLGVSVEDQKAAYDRIPLLLDTPAAVRFLSCEPLLGPIDLTVFLYDEVEGTTMPDFSSLRASNRGLSWVIIGGESGSNARSCDVQWIRDLVEQCQAAGVRTFVKQMGKWIKGDHSGFVVNRWMLDNGRVFVPPIVGARAHDKPAGALAFGNCDTHGGNWVEWPDDLRVREFPVEVAA